MQGKFLMNGPYLQTLITLYIYMHNISRQGPGHRS